MNFIDEIKQQVNPKLKKQLKLSNDLSVPKIEKIVVAMGLGEAVGDKSVVDKAANDLAEITGQKPLITKARKSVASFKLRQGMPIGVKVTLRKKRQYHFLEKLIKIVLPRIRDFQGVSRQKFDGRGNYTLGFKEQIVFPEIDYAKIDRVRGLEVTIVTSATDDQTAQLLLSEIGIPFTKEE